MSRILIMLGTWRPWLLLASIGLGLPLSAGPAEFGRNELDRAFADRRIQPDGTISVKIVPGRPESYRIELGMIEGGDERGLMYGLLEAAEQIRESGHLRPSHGEAETPIRGIRYFIHNHDLEEDWYYSRDYWNEYFAMLARNRFNRFNLVYGANTTYLASPPYPYLIDVPEFPDVRVRGLSAEQRERNLDILRYISESAAAHGIDFTLGIWQQTVSNEYKFHGPGGAIEGLTKENIGPYMRAALSRVLGECPLIRSIQLRIGESGIPGGKAADFFRDWVFPAIRAANHPVTLDVRAHGLSSDVINAVKDAGMPYRFSAKYWAEKLGRPYQPPVTFPGYDYGSFLEKAPDGTRPYDFYFEVWSLGSNRLLLWGDPDYVRRIVPTFRLSGAAGFEIDPPLAQKGYGNAPGKWGIFTDEASKRAFWKYEFERYWLFYRLWGRLSYDTSTAATSWTGEAVVRFGHAAEDVLAAYKHASGVIPEIVAAHMPDASMGNWPEVNPGGLIDEYCDTRPGDWCFIASPREAVQNRLRGVQSAKQTPYQTAAILDRLAAGTEQAMERVAKTVPAQNEEWSSTESDLRVLALLARYHALKQKAAYEVAWFDETESRPALDLAQQNLNTALAVWEQLVNLTDGLYPEGMSFGPFDTGHWKDRLPYVRYDLDLIRERAAIFDRFGDFDYGFDFEGPISPVRTGPHVPNRDDTDGWQKNIAPRFRHVDPESRYSEASGFGWASEGDRTAVTIAPVDYTVLTSMKKNPDLPPADVLFRDYIRGRGTQVFKVRASDGEYTVLLLHPDRTATSLALNSVGGILAIPFPPDDWAVSGLIVKSSRARIPGTTLPPEVPLPRPLITHQPPGSVVPGQSVQLSLKVAPQNHVSMIRLHYRTLKDAPNKNGEIRRDGAFQTLESASSNPVFTIPAEDIPPGWDLIYYFEILNDQKTGWFQPDPLTATPYYVLSVGPNSRRTAGHR